MDRTHQGLEFKVTVLWYLLRKLGKALPIRNHNARNKLEPYCEEGRAFYFGLEVGPKNHYGEWADSQTFYDTLPALRWGQVMCRNSDWERGPQ